MPLERELPVSLCEECFLRNPLERINGLGLFSVLLVVAGIVLLSLALVPTRGICQKKQQVCVGWKFLGILICCFILSYAAFCYMLVVGPPTFLRFIVSLILFGGSVFVIMVVRLSGMSISRVEEMVVKERHRALHDELTDLSNRTHLEERLDYTILQAKRRKESFVLLLLDLVRFKEINDSLGHFYGDYVLQKVAERLLDLVRDSDTLARVGGDEFGLLLPQANEQDAIKICQKISAALEEPYVIEGNRFSIGVSIGVAVYPDHGLDIETLIHQADTAMYEAKRNEVIYAVFHPSQDRATLDRLIFLGELREAMAKDQLFLCYQPKVSPSQVALTGVEALVRWQHPEKGPVQPNNFIPLIEQAGLSKHLTNWVLNNALKQISEWKKIGLCLPVSVNLSIKDLHDFQFPEYVANLLAKWDADPDLLVLEVTESCMMVDTARVNKVVSKLEEMGLHLSIDDFGTGYSSLSYLLKFPAKEIKIDRSFVTDMCRNEESRIIVKSTIEMVHNIGRYVVAEGVEDEETYQHLASIGCDQIQGYYICRPLLPEKLHEWFELGDWKIPYCTENKRK